MKILWYKADWYALDFQLPGKPTWRSLYVANIYIRIYGWWFGLRPPSLSGASVRIYSFLGWSITRTVRSSLLSLLLHWHRSWGFTQHGCSLSITLSSLPHLLSHIGWVPSALLATPFTCTPFFPWGGRHVGKSLAAMRVGAYPGTENEREYSTVLCGSPMEQERSLFLREFHV